MPLRGKSRIAWRGFRSEGGTSGGTDPFADHAVGIDQLAPGLHTGEAAGNPGEILPPQLLLCQSEGAVICGDGLDLTPAQSFPQGILLLLGAMGGAQTYRAAEDQSGLKYTLSSSSRYCGQVST